MVAVVLQGGRVAGRGYVAIILGRRVGKSDGLGLWLEGGFCLCCRGDDKSNHHLIISITVNG